MPEPLKNLINQTFFENLAGNVRKHRPDFDQKEFFSRIFDDEWEDRELKARMRHGTFCLHETLRMTYPDTIDLFKKIISGSSGFGCMIFPDYVEVFGLEYPEISLDALAHFTEWASAEFAIRPFIVKYEERVMRRMSEWAGNENHHLRRLASEGCRPRLPWAMALPKFKKDPAPVLPILEKLKADPSEFVRRSVANNLNDISKDHPDLVLKIARKWIRKKPETDWIVKHALRTLLKQGNTQALILFGFGDPKNIGIEALQLSPEILKIGADLFFQFGLNNHSEQPARLRLEYKIDFVKKTGKTSPKVFKISENTYPPGKAQIKRKQTFQDMSTRKHYPGTHRLTILINGVPKAKAEFELKA